MNAESTARGQREADAGRPAPAGTENHAGPAADARTATHAGPEADARPGTPAGPAAAAGARAIDAKRAATATVRDVGAFIREQRTAARMSVRHLAKVAGVSNPYLSQIERGLRAPSAHVLQAIAQGLRISAETLYVRAGILEERDDDLAERILADPWLSESQKRALLEIYRSFRGAADAPPTGDHRPDLPEG